MDRIGTTAHERPLGPPVRGEDRVSDRGIRDAPRNRLYKGGSEEEDAGGGALDTRPRQRREVSVE